MLNLDEIKKPIDGELNAFEEKFKASMKSTVPLLDRVTHYIIKRKGKQIRPMFVFFSATICGGVLIGMIPAIQAMRNALKDGLSVRI